MNRTKIEWVKNPDGTQGYTWNPITGCLNYTSEGLCLGGLFPCYAYRLANGRLRERYLANDNFRVYKERYDPMQLRDIAFYGKDPFYPRFWPERIPPHTYHKMDWKGVPIGVFVCDMGELFGDWIPHDWQAEIFDVILNNPWHRFYLLTKQPQNLIKFSPFPEHCYVGVTVCNDGMMTLALTNLANIEARVKFVSIEPHLGFISMKSHPIKGILDWLIIGAQTKPYKPPEIEWVEEIEQSARQAGIPIFEKDNLKSLLQRELTQEMPK